MNGVYKVIAGVGMLIFVYLIVSNGMAVSTIISSLASNATAGVKTLQGRA